MKYGGDLFVAIHRTSLSQLVVRLQRTAWVADLQAIAVADELDWLLCPVIPVHECVYDCFADDDVGNEWNILAINPVFHGETTGQIAENGRDDPRYEGEQGATHFNGLESRVRVFYPYPSRSADIIYSNHGSKASECGIPSKAQEAADCRRIVAIFAAIGRTEGEKQFLI